MRSYTPATWTERDELELRKLEARKREYRSVLAQQAADIASGIFPPGDTTAVAVILEILNAGYSIEKD